MMNMPALLIADDDIPSRKRMADLFIKDGYWVTVANSVAGVLGGILKESAQVLLLSVRFDELMATELIPLLKKCNRNLTIILVASELPIAFIINARREGIFYHALKPVRSSDEEELRQVVKCAFEKKSNRPAYICL